MNIYCSIIEQILYKRDRNSSKDWGHIRWWTTIYSYCRWNSLEEPISSYEKYIDKHFITDDSFISMIREWYFWKFERKFLQKYQNDFDDNFLYNFLIWISTSKAHKYDYYFKFAESINTSWIQFLLKSYKQNPNYLFSNIAIWSYYQHNQKLDLAYKFYIQALKIDKNNPWILAKLAILFSSLWGESNLLKAEKTMRKVVKLLPDTPWVNAWYWETLNMIGKYYEALEYFKKYEEITEWKHRTFEPFMRKAESYIGLWDFRKARFELDKEKKYYFWEWYRFVYDKLDNKLKKLWY